PMAVWLKAALEGDRQALQWVVSVNPWLTYHPKITAHLQEATEHQDHALHAAIAQSLKQEPAARKHATNGLILMMLWEAGLHRLTYKQLRGFLKSAGLEGLPTAQALERYAQRLGLKKNVRDGESANRHNTKSGR